MGINGGFPVGKRDEAEREAAMPLSDVDKVWVDEMLQAMRLGMGAWSY